MRLFQILKNIFLKHTSQVHFPIFVGNGLQPGIHLDRNAALRDLMENSDRPHV